MKHRNKRQEAIRDIIREKSIRTQRALVDELKAQGFNCTQATVSRDITDMGLKKLPEGVYVLSEDLQLQRMLSGSLRDLETEDLLLMLILYLLYRESGYPEWLLTLAAMVFLS